MKSVLDVLKPYVDVAISVVKTDTSDDDSSVELEAGEVVELVLDPSSGALTASCTPPCSENISGGGLK